MSVSSVSLKFASTQNSWSEITTKRGAPGCTVLPGRSERLATVPLAGASTLVRSRSSSACFTAELAACTAALSSPDLPSALRAWATLASAARTVASAVASCVRAFSAPCGERNPLFISSWLRAQLARALAASARRCTSTASAEAIPALSCEAPWRASCSCARARSSAIS